MYRVMLALAMVAVVAAPVAVSAARQDAVPPTPCTVQPRTEADIAALVAAAPTTPGGDEERASDAWATSPADLPQGELADPATVAAVTAAAREFAGCLNAGDIPRWLALMTDRLLPKVVGSFGMAALLEATGTPIPGEIPEPKIVTVRIADARVLPDGRVGAVVAWTVRQAPGEQPLPEANFHIFQRVGTHWLLDEEMSGYVEAEPGPDSRREVDGPAAIPAAVDEGALEVEAVLEAAEIERVVYVEPTKASAPFRIEAIVFGPIVGDDVLDATCTQFTFERGVGETTVSAQCRAEAGVSGHELSLAVQAYSRGRGLVNVCEDTVPLADEMDLSCTVEDPVTAA